MAERLRARELCQALGALSPAVPQAERSDILARLFGVATNAYVTPPFFCDYGSNIQLGDDVNFNFNFNFNFNCVILDVAKVVVGSRVLFGPAVQVYTASHPMAVEERRSGLEFARLVTIGSDVWL